MTKWTRNICIAGLIALLICWLLYGLSTGNYGPDLSDVLPFLIGCLLLGGALTSVIWALGLTRLSHGATRQRSAIILTYLEQAVRLNLPLPQMLLAAEMSEPRWIASGIGKLRQELQAGRSIADALRKAVPGTSWRTVALVGAAERVGRVGSELNRIVRQQQNERNRGLSDRAFLRSYPLAMILVVTVIISMLMIYVVPRYMQIFHDFKIPLPALTRALIDFSWAVVAPLWLTFAILVVGLIFTVKATRRYFNWPGPLNWFATHRDYADVCHIISQALEAGLPLDAAIDESATLSIGKPLRRKLRSWADGIVGGMTSAESAHAAGLPRLIAGLTTTAEGFAFLSRYYAAQFSRLRMLLRAAAIPAMVFAFGIVVGIVALALFLPIVALINCTGPFQSVL